MANGGGSGVAFSDKLVSLGWVVSVRGAIMLLLPLIILSIIILAVFGVIFGIDESGLQLYGEYIGLVVMLVYVAWVWLKTSSHIRQLR